MMMRHIPAVLALVVLGAVSCLVCASTAEAAARGALGNPRVVPPNANFRGRSYGAWSEAWWQWALSLPTDRHPLFDTADCSEGQTGNVWFLGGTFTLTEPEPGTVVGIAARECTIPPGTALFFPLINAFSSTLDLPGATESELRSDVQCFIDHVQARDLFAEIDGVPVEHLDAYRATSELFPIGPLPENNLLGVDEGTEGLAVADGYYLLLKPLSRGEHAVEFEASLFIPARDCGFETDFSFTLDINYTITVER